MFIVSHSAQITHIISLKIVFWSNQLTYTDDSIFLANHCKYNPLKKMYCPKWNESGFRPPLCTYRLNWARRTSWGWWDDWDDTVLQTQDSKFEPWRSEAEHATSRSRRLPTILTFTREWGRNNFVSFKPPRPGTEPRTLAWKAAVLTTTLGTPPCIVQMINIVPKLLCMLCRLHIAGQQILVNKRSARFKSGTHAWMVRQSAALPKRDVAFASPTIAPKAIHIRLWRNMHQRYGSGQNALVHIVRST